MNRDEKRQIQLSIMSKTIESILHNLGLDTKFALIQVKISEDIQKKHQPSILLYEQLVKNSTISEIKKIPNFEKTFFGLINFYYNLKDYSNAMKKIEFMLSINPNNFNIEYCRGKLYESFEQPEKALECYQIVLKMKHDHLPALRDASITYARQGKHEYAINLLDKMIEINPLDIESLHNKGIFLLEKESFEDAITCFDKVLDINSKHLSALYQKGIALEALSQFESALKCHELVLSIKHDHLSSLSQMNILFDKICLYNESIEALDKIILRNPKYVLALYNKGMLLLKAKQYEDAITCFDKVLDINSKHLSALYQKGIALEALSQMGKALECYQSIINIDPHHEDVAIRTGRTLYSFGRHVEAIECYGLVLKSNPDDINALYYKLLSTLEQGNEIELIPLLEHVLLLDSRYIEFLKNEPRFSKYLKLIIKS